MADARQGKSKDEALLRIIKLRFDNQAAFAKAAGLSERTVSSVLARGLPNTNLHTFRLFVKTLGLDADAALDGRYELDDDPSKPVQVPLFGSIAAGTPIEPEYADDTFPIPAQLHRKYPDAFMLSITGNSMNQVFPDGSYVLVDPCDAVDVSGGRYALTVGDGKATVKQVLLHDNGMSLHAETDDPTYSDIILLYSDPTAEPVSVIGRVVWSLSPTG